VQFIDGRDLGIWIIQLVETRETGIFNAAGPEAPISLGDLLEAAWQITGSGAQVTWAAPEYLVDQGVEPWRELPLWLPEEQNAGVFQVDIGKALAHGLSLRPLAETVSDTLAWAAERPADHEWHAGLSREREAALLAAWNAA
jgi:2'-hydroxyisoflavone reductase